MYIRKIVILDENNSRRTLYNHTYLLNLDQPNRFNHRYQILSNYNSPNIYQFTVIYPYDHLNK